MRSQIASADDFCKIYVGCLPPSAELADLFQLFGDFGQIEAIEMLRGAEGSFRGCCFVSFKKREAAENCLKNLNGKFFICEMRTPVQLRFSHEIPKSEKIRIFSDEIEKIEKILWLYGEILAIEKNDKNLCVVFVNPESAKRIKMDNEAGAGQLNGVACFIDDCRGGNAGGGVVEDVGGISVGGFCLENSSGILGASILGASCLGASCLGASLGAPSSGLPPSSPPSAPPSAPVTAPEAPPAIEKARPISFSTSSSECENAETVDDGVEKIPIKLFVGCLPFSKTVADLKILFESFGEIVEVVLLTGPDGKSKGAAFVTFAKTADGFRAMNCLNGFVFPSSSRPINVSLATRQNFPKVFSNFKNPKGNFQGNFQGNGGARRPNLQNFTNDCEFSNFLDKLEFDLKNVFSKKSTRDFSE